MIIGVILIDYSVQTGEALNIWWSQVCVHRCRYRGEKEANDVGVTISEQQPSFTHWCRLWDIYHNKQLLTTFRALMHRCGLRVRAHVDTGDII